MIKVKTYLYCMEKGKKTKIFKTDRLNALDIIDKYEEKSNIQLGTVSSTSFSTAVKTYREFSPYVEVTSEKELISSEELEKA